MLHQIVLSYGAIHPCCSYTISKTNSQLMIDYYGQIIDVDEYIKSRQVYVNAFNEGKIPECFVNCSLYEKSDNSSDKVCFEIINVSNRTNCNCNCIYCDLRENGNQNKKTELNNRKPYDVHPVLVDMKNKNLIANNCDFFVGGGEISEYPKDEIDWLLYFALSNNCKLQLMSSGIKYSDSIEKILKVADINLKISPDSGKKETYEKIKRVKAFDVVWSNLAKYVKAASNNNKAVIEIKYVLIPGLNDNLDEINAFVEKCKSINAKNIVVDIEHYWLYDENRKEIPNSLIEAVKFFEELRINSDFHVDYIQVGKEFLMEIVK